MGDMKERNTHRERERDTKSISLINKNATVTRITTTTTFTKGYKVTLYSDSLRATAVYANYTNVPNLGYPRG